MAGAVGIVVNTELVQDEIKGYNDVFQTKFSKNIVVLDDAREIVGWAFDTLGIPINEASDENLEKVKPVLAKWLPLVKVFDSDSPKTALLNGDVALGVIWGGEGAIPSMKTRNSNGSCPPKALISSWTIWPFQRPPHT